MSKGPYIRQNRDDRNRVAPVGQTLTCPYSKPGSSGICNNLRLPRKGIVAMIPWHLPLENSVHETAQSTPDSLGRCRRGILPLVLGQHAADSHLEPGRPPTSR